MIALQDASEVLTELPPRQQFVAVAMAVVILAVVIELVRRRKLREEYSALWIGTALALMTLALWPRLLNLFCSAIGATTSTPALLFGAVVFLMAVSLLVSIRLSKLTFRNKALGQQLALQRRELEELREDFEQVRKQVGVGSAPQFPSKPHDAKAEDGAA